MRVEGGMLVGGDGRIHTTFGHNPSSLRLCSFDPNLQNIPRSDDDEDAIANYVKDMFVAPEGSLFWERDYSAIEAVLVGYFAGDPIYTRCAKLGIHDFLASHILGRPADFSWSVEDLKDCFREIKSNHKSTRDTAKRVVHLSNYLGTPRRMHELYPETFQTTKDAAKLQGLYFDLFPSIRRWHRDLCVRVDGTKQRRTDEEVHGDIDPWSLGVCYARNPQGYVHHFYSVLEWEKIGNEWVSSFGEDAKRLVSFLPQSTAAAIIKQSAKKLYYENPRVGETLRLLIHDSILGEAAEGEIDECLKVSQEIMEAPIQELPLDPEWKMGEYLSIGSESKAGKSWGAMH